MPKPNKGPRLGGGPAHERLLLNTMAAQLFTHKRIQTTETKAKRLQPVADRLITFAKRGDLAARRRVLRQITDKTVVHELFTEIAPLVEERSGGYTRVIKTGFRKGDNAPLAIIELVLEPVTPRVRAQQPVVEEAVTEDAVVEETVTEENAADETVTVEEAESASEPQDAADDAAADTDGADESAEESAESKA